MDSKQDIVRKARQGYIKKEKVYDIIDACMENNFGESGFFMNCQLAEIKNAIKKAK